MYPNELEEKKELLAITRRRKFALDRQAALFGAAVEPHVTLEREDLAREIAQLEQEIAALECGAQRAIGARMDGKQRDEGQAYHRAASGSVQSGLATALTFLISALFLALQPQYFGEARIAVSGVCGTFGAFGLGIELSKIQPRGGFDHFGSGVAAAIFGLTFYHYRYLATDSPLFGLGLCVAGVLALYKLALGVFNAVSE